MTNKEMTDVEKMQIYPQIKDGKYYYSIETELFYFDVYRAWHASTDRNQDMFRAGVALKKDGRKYHIFHELFAEWDYASKDVAFNEAKKWLLKTIVGIGTQLLESGNASEIGEDT